MYQNSRCLKTIFLLIAFSVIVIATFKFVCNKLQEGDMIEIARLKSPDSSLEAVVVNYDPGGLGGTDNGILISIVPAGTKFENAEFSGEKLSGLSLRWINPNLLEIHYRKGRIFSFTNIFTKNNSSGSAFDSIVEIKLVKDGDEVLDIYHDHGDQQKC